MKIYIRNFTNKKRSKRLNNEIKSFAEQITIDLGIDSKIKKITIYYKNDWGHSYYQKNKPFAGFNFLLSDRNIKIILTDFWDVNPKARREAIIHELTHVQQLINKKLVIVKNKNVLWNNKPQNNWKKFSFSKFESFSNVKSRTEYLINHFPWEKEVTKNLKKYNYH